MFSKQLHFFVPTVLYSTILQALFSNDLDKLKRIPRMRTSYCYLLPNWALEYTHDCEILEARSGHIEATEIEDA